MQRIHIMGAAASGKTTLAKQLAAHLQSPLYELDTVAYEGGFARKRTLDERSASLQEIIAQEAWVTEGFYLWWIDPLLQAASIIVWLDLPWYVSMPRIVTRHIKLSMTGENRHPGVINLLDFTWGCRRYYLEKIPCTPQSLDQDYGVNRVGVVQYLRQYSHKLVHCHSAADVKSFLAQIGSSRS